MATFVGKTAQSVGIMFSLYFGYLQTFESRVWVLIDPVPGYCLLVTFNSFLMFINEQTWKIQNHLHRFQ